MISESDIIEGIATIVEGRDGQDTYAFDLYRKGVLLGNERKQKNSRPISERFPVGCKIVCTDPEMKDTFGKVLIVTGTGETYVKVQNVGYFLPREVVRVCED